MILISTTNQTHSIALGQRLTLRTVVKMRIAVLSKLPEVWSLSKFGQTQD